ncbi:hypothetical protein Aab01nite_79550 [Paractinoplanes abujensis]|uniref:Uncharacterized protein n=1 Tax=Paractinoplanes abujensis TaxID=882441 RepID=A0A7W7CR27_9ACTN|nr:hypothetical protein [Actinoplanes abujensis]MBB4693164.1 hypothetical protein [Actinoplanes abujensis]GID24365.1 hypothetical protein Aab01nite_79550 [Actinoplanes abujensis]
MAGRSKVWFRLRTAGAPPAVRGDATIQACCQLRDAGADLIGALDGSTTGLDRGFASMKIAEWMGNDRPGNTLDRTTLGAGFGPPRPRDVKVGQNDVAVR